MVEESQARFSFAIMSSSFENSAVSQIRTHPGFMLAQTRQSVIDVAHQEEIQRLSQGGKHLDHSSDFTIYVLLPLVVFLGVIIVGRRIFF
jgi:hypothetical protein